MGKDLRAGKAVKRDEMAPSSALTSEATAAASVGTASVVAVADNKLDGTAQLVSRKFMEEGVG